MKKSITLVLSAIVLLSWSAPAFGQKDLLKELFDKEEPVFSATFAPTPVKGEVMMTLYYTHPKVDAIEYAVWIKDQGAALNTGRDREIVRGLKLLGNRQVDTVLISGLSDLHFYSFGLDYRNPQGISRKFIPQVLREVYRYEGNIRPAGAPAIASNRPVPPPVMPSPCVNPELDLRLDPAGYCGGQNRPAVLLQCRNCTDKQWAFSVEIRSEYEDWRPLRSDGQRQTASGMAIRTEPLCLLRPGRYFVRALAWGDNCPNPVAYTISSPVLVTDPAPVRPENRGITAKAPAIPDTCTVFGQAALSGNVIRGTLELPRQSPCLAFNPYARVTYVHPGYRDLNLDHIPLVAGSITPFELAVDGRDLARGIHTLQVTVFASPDARTAGVPVESFWIRARVTETIPSLLGARPAETEPESESPESVKGMAGASRPGYAPVEPGTPSGRFPSTSANASPPASAVASNEADFDETLLESDIQTINVSATDPNCTQIQDLQLVFDPDNPQKPLFVSWLSPRCCQEEGCAYTVWAGRSPQQLKLLTKGNKPGAIVRELLPDLRAEDKYFEVVVKSPNGMRKAAYVIGEGPKYGIEEILAYHDRLKPPASDTLVARWEASAAPGEMPAEGAKGSADPAVFIYDEPSLPISNFQPCKYQRETTLQATPPVRDGDRIRIRYDLSDKGYHYTLYLLPEGVDEWVLAPGTRELQDRPEFDLVATPYHSGKYLMLVKKSSSNWGCLSAPLSEPLEINVLPRGSANR